MGIFRFVANISWSEGKNGTLELCFADLYSQHPLPSNDFLGIFVDVLK